jgi:DNA-binding NarL/FixJ family response regulator
VTKPSQRARVLIVDDHPAVREALAMRIANCKDLEVCGEADDLAAALTQIEATRPDVAVIDISLKTGNGIDLIKRIKSRNHSVRILVWSMYEESLYAERALRAGAMGYLSKEHATPEIVTAIRRILEGKVYVSEAVTDRLLTFRVGSRPDSDQGLCERLSDRELEVFALIGNGLPTREIARRLHVGVKTIETHRQRIKFKLNIGTNAALIRAAAQWVLEHG